MHKARPFEDLFGIPVAATEIPNSPKSKIHTIVHGEWVIREVIELYHSEYFFSDPYILPQFRETATLFGASRFDKLAVSSNKLYHGFNLP